MRDRQRAIASASLSVKSIWRSASASTGRCTRKLPIWRRDIRGVTVLETVTRENEQTRRLPKIVEEQTVDGLIVIGWMEKDYVSRLVEDSGIPVVLLDFNLKDVRCDAVMSNNYMGMYKATRYLLEHGHCDIAFVGSVHANDNIMDRYFGYCKALYEKGLKVRREWLLEDRDIESGDMMVTLPENMPTAFACNSDLAAGYLYDALVEKGYRIPEDISIVAYDNYLFGHPFAEQLTTYNVDMERMAASAMNSFSARSEASKSITASDISTVIS